MIQNQVIFVSLPLQMSDDRREVVLFWDVRENLEAILYQWRSNRPIWFAWRYYCEPYYESIALLQVWRITLSVVGAYTQPEHCLHLGDHLVHEQLSDRYCPRGDRVRLAGPDRLPFAARNPAWQFPPVGKCCHADFAPACLAFGDEPIFNVWQRIA